MLHPLSKRGYTLLEILTVITIILIVSAIVYPAFASARYKARETTCILQMQQIVHAYQMYRQDWDGKDTGSTSAEFGLFTSRQAVQSCQYVPGYNIDWHMVKCPNRFISGKPPFEECQKCFSYFTYESYPGIDYFRHLSEDATWPIISCPYHDLAFWRGVSGRADPISLGITLNGGLTRKPLEKLNSDGQRLKQPQ